MRCRATSSGQRERHAHEVGAPAMTAGASVGRGPVDDGLTGGRRPEHLVPVPAGTARAVVGNLDLDRPAPDVIAVVDLLDGADAARVDVGARGERIGETG